MMELAIVIVSFNARRDLEACLASLADHPPATPHEIVVVDNASADGSAEGARAFGARVIVLDKNAGFAAANNVGIRATESDLILLLNSDTIVPAGAVDALAERLRARPDVAIAGPRLVDADGRPELSFGKMIDPIAEWQRKNRQQQIEKGSPEELKRLDEDTAREQEVDWVSGACLLVRRADAESAGLLDERFFLYTEDVDFCYAVRRLGRKVLFSPVATVTHLRGRSRASRPEASRRAYRRSHVAFYEKHHPALAPVLKLYLRLKGEWPDPQS
jgi:N-acetylglucosaminyl-diphospho-decaprenol L-rhamnosyltransferase